VPSALTPIRLLVAMFPLCLLAYAQCPVNTVIVKGRIERPVPEHHYQVRVQLVYPRHKPGESGEVTVEDAIFNVPVEFVTAQSSLFSNLPRRCGANRRLWSSLC
jgi:hypothetical protein